MSKLTTLINEALAAKADIKAALEEMGVTDVGDKLAEYGDKIRSIKTAGTSDADSSSSSGTSDYDEGMA